MNTYVISFDGKHKDIYNVTHDNDIRKQNMLNKLADKSVKETNDFKLFSMVLTSQMHKVPMYELTVPYDENELLSCTSTKLCDILDQYGELLYDPR